jgi:hypothetical protein
MNPYKAPTACKMGMCIPFQLRISRMWYSDCTHMPSIIECFEYSTTRPELDIATWDQPLTLPRCVAVRQLASMHVKMTSRSSAWNIGQI